MDISGLGASKLLEALEKLGVSKGAELRSLGPQGEPPAELVRAFEDALRAPDGQGGPSVQGVAEGSREHGPFEEAGQDIPEVARTDEAIPPNPSEDPVYGISEGSRIDGIGGTMRIESPSGPQAVEGRTDAVQTDGMQELARLLERVGGGTLPRRSCTSCNSLWGCSGYRPRAGRSCRSRSIRVLNRC